MIEDTGERKTKCFACSEPIGRGKHVKWHGDLGETDADFVLHIECANWIATAMKRDVVEWCLGRDFAEHWYRGPNGARSKEDRLQ